MLTMKERKKDQVVHQEEVYHKEGQEVQEDQVDLEAHHQDMVDLAVQVDHHQAIEDHLQAILNTEDHHQVDHKVDHHQVILLTEAHHQAVQAVHKVNQILLAEDDWTISP
jgi:hypothetical protein